MIRSFNFTGRRKIERKHVTVTVHHDVRPLEFDLTLDLDPYGFPADSSVMVEAYYRSSAAFMRFHFGTVANVVPPRDRRLTDIDGDIVFFRVKIVDEGQKRLLGMAENIQAGTTDESSGGRFNLLPVNFVDLGDEIWNLKLDPRPILEVNSQIEGVRELVHNRIFFGCVYPEVVRKVLGHIGSEVTDDDIEVQWKAMWVRYAQSLAGQPEGQELESIAAWIEDVVDQFARSHKVKDHFASRLAEN